jgi:hypothetical protein
MELLLEPELSIVWFRYAASDAVNAEILLRLPPHHPLDTIFNGHRRPPGDPALLYQPPHPAGRRGHAR